MRAEDVQAIKEFRASTDRVFRQIREADAFFREAPKQLKQLAANPPPASVKTVLAAAAITGLAIAGVVYAADAFAKRRGWTQRITDPAKNQAAQSSTLGR